MPARTAADVDQAAARHDAEPVEVDGQHALTLFIARS
jgi:hypothetical protein